MISYIAIVYALLCARVFAQDPRVIAGVPVIHNVTQHARIDLDVAAIVSSLANNQEAEALNVYSNGQNSMRGSSLRTIKGFSRDLTDKIYDLFKEFYQVPDFGDRFIQSAFASTGDFIGRNPQFRAAAINTAVNTLNIWNYVINEMADGVIDCKNGDSLNNIGSVLSVEEAWAFYVGSLEKSSAGGDPAAGVGLFRMSTNLCQTFGTCDTLQSGHIISKVNRELAGNFSELILTTQQEVNPCSRSQELENNIINTMKIPIVQGFIDSALRAATAADAATRDRNWGAAWAFRQTIAPLISRCAPSVIEQMELLNPRLNTVFPSVTQTRAIITGLESTYFCMGISCRDVGAATSLGHTRCNDRSLAGYSFRTPVMDRAFIDLDIRRISQLLSADFDQAKWDAALKIYQQGLSSIKASGSVRTLAGLSRDFTKFQNEPMWKIFREFYKSDTYGDDFVMRAFRGEAPFSTAVDSDVRRQGIVKGIQFYIVWYYVIHELEQGLADCFDGRNTDNSDDGDFVANVDEAWAFFTGSLHWSASNETGYLMYNQNLKRCKDFGTCVTGVGETRSVANDKTLAAMVSLQAAAEVKNCEKMQEDLDVVKIQMMVPTIQGMLRYFFLADPKNNPDDDLEDLRGRWAEGYVFFKTLEPLINQCDASVATLIRSNIDLSIGLNNLMKDGFLTVSKALQSIYPCLEVSCADIGQFTRYPAGVSLQCRDPTPPFSMTLAGYNLLADVIDRARIDLDVRDIDEFMKVDNFEAARQRYTQGLNSVKESGQVRSIYDFTFNFERFEGEETWTLFKNYYNSSTYAHDLISAALNNQGVFTKFPASVRREVAIKTIQYQAVWNYILHELDESYESCEVAKLTGQVENTEDAFDVDDAWAYFVGSSHLQDPAAKGYLMYQANLKRCKEFGTCMGNLTTRSRANDRTLALFVSSQSAATVRDCVTMKENMYKIRAQMTVPLIQGMLKYVYVLDKSDPNKPKATEQDELQEEWAEGFAFARSVLPIINQCDPEVAKLVDDNLKLDQEKPVSMGAEALTKAVQSVFPCMNITCAEVGAFVPSLACQDPDFSASSGSSDSLSGGAIAGIVIACLVFYALSLIFVYYRGKKSGSEMGNQNAGIDQKGHHPEPPTGNGKQVSNGNLLGVTKNGNGNQDQLEVV